MQQIQPQPIAGIEGFLILAILEDPDTAISQYTIAIHQNQPDACRSFMN